jgi:hypothetical protein
LEPTSLSLILSLALTHSATSALPLAVPPPLPYFKVERPLNEVCAAA